MTAITALGVAVLALALSCAGIWALAAWRNNRRALEALAERLYFDTKLEAMTIQALAAMRAAARGRSRQP